MSPIPGLTHSVCVCARSKGMRRAKTWCVCVFGCVWLVVPGVRKPIQNGLNQVSGPHLVMPELRESIQNGLNRVSGAYLVAPGVRKTHSEWAQPGIGPGIGTPFGSA